MEFVTFLGKDKENWGQITAIINRMEWEKIILVKDKNTEEFTSPKKIDILSVNSEKSLLDLKQDIMSKLKSKIGELEVGLSIASGNGKEHMALISALLSLPVGIRLVVFTKDGLQFIN